MPEIKSITLRFEPDTKVSPTTLRSLRKKVMEIRDWADWAGVGGPMVIEMDVEVDDEQD